MIQHARNARNDCEKKLIEIPCHCFEKTRIEMAVLIIGYASFIEVTHDCKAVSSITDNALYSLKYTLFRIALVHSAGQKWVPLLQSDTHFKFTATTLNLPLNCVKSTHVYPFLSYPH